MLRKSLCVGDIDDDGVVIWSVHFSVHWVLQAAITPLSRDAKNEEKRK